MNLFALAATTQARRAIIAGGPAGAGEFDLSWTAVAGAAGYRVYSTQSNPGATEVFDQEIGSGVDAGNVTSYRITGLASGTWYFGIRHYNAADAAGEVFEGELSNVISGSVT